jgi:hypothetical protein
LPLDVKLVTQLVLLYDGANISAQLDHNPGAAAANLLGAAQLTCGGEPASR